jgi:hypothetical protein
MKRYTIYKDEQWRLNEDVDIFEAVDRLAKFEEFLAKMIASQAEIVEDLAKLRAEGKEKTVQYRELFTKKLLTNNVLAFLRYHGIKED